MNRFPTTRLLEIQARVEALTESKIAPMAQRVDRECIWPAHSMQALADEGLLGLNVAENLGGLGQGLLGLSVVTETIGRVCPSSALCFGMHSVATAVIAAKATRYQEDQYLRPIARGEHITTLALAEQGSGAHFWLPETSLAANDGHYRVNGAKQFVTNGGHADSYVISTLASEETSELGDFSCLVVDRDTAGMTWLEAWQGFGMRGNSSRGVRFDDACVPRGNLLGQEGDQVWYVFEVVAPYFLMAMAGTYLGIAQSAVDLASNHLRSRGYSHSGETLAGVEALQTCFAEMWVTAEKCRGLVREAATRGDLGQPDALPFLLACKADAADTAVKLANDAMTLCGGQAYRENSRVAQILRDARAGHVMSPTTNILKSWTGRALLGLPLL
ncbi:acyl-CoA dehydrogenase family protein [Hydrocarboniclastica marina]|uniref:Acyl-CoA dehydrogenase n=1 Tax=Hydrocarboniclastica marina TaxID=2259620 RepID=A0A4P7XJS0_9ALTE|nr:acyl-CoA dehydrogenase family protein [Hydrocarboniclastica marina]QCF26804.1 acyl-CoA dehydrogenase [Hydrocarboniclastica marina]